jgi:phosphatidylglycerol:prolipoprotein diacylglycerol transferase
MLPKLISIGSFFLPTYGLLTALAFLLALWVTVRLGKRTGLESERITNLGIYCALAGMAGAKLAMFLFDWSYYTAHPRELFSITTLQAAGVFQGGLALAIVTAYLYTRRFRMPGLLTADAFAPGIALGHAIGRLGCFSAGCCWGTRTSVPWAVTFNNPDANRMFGTPIGVPLHPTQLYESFAELCVFAVLLWRFRKAHRPGEIIGLYLIVSSVLRFWIEFYRFHEQPLIAGLSLTQWISLVLIVAGALVLLARPRQTVAMAA